MSTTVPNRYSTARATTGAPQVRVHATCTVCRQQGSTGPEYDHEAALDLLDCLGWTDLDTWPLCPTCASWQGVKTA